MCCFVVMALLMRQLRCGRKWVPVMRSWVNTGRCATRLCRSGGARGATFDQHSVTDVDLPRFEDELTHVCLVEDARFGSMTGCVSAAACSAQREAASFTADTFLICSEQGLALTDVDTSPDALRDTSRSPRRCAPGTRSSSVDLWC